MSLVQACTVLGPSSKVNLMNQQSDSFAQLSDHIAGTLYDIANEGEKENENLYSAFEEVAAALLETFNVTITKASPLEATIAIKR